jgi:hypothetical protein
MAIRGWGGAKPVARRGCYREIVATFGYGHNISFDGHGHWEAKLFLNVHACLVSMLQEEKGDIAAR